MQKRLAPGRTSAETRLRPPAKTADDVDSTKFIGQAGLNELDFQPAAQRPAPETFSCQRHELLHRMNLQCIIGKPPTNANASPIKHSVTQMQEAIYTVSQTQMANVDRFSKFFHRLICKNILYVCTAEISISPAVCCYTTL